MKVIICKEPGEMIYGERPLPARRPDEALVKILRVGVCGTDLHAFAGRQPFFSYPRIFGHELSGEVVEADPNSMGLRRGDRVVVIPYLHCGQCVACRQGKTNCCERLKVLGVHIDGGMQEYLSLPVEYLLPAGDLSPEQAAIVEPLSIGAHAVRRAALQSGEWTLVVGAGPIGLGIMKFAQLQGSRVIAMDLSGDRLDFCRRVMEVEYTINGADDPKGRLLKITGGEGAAAVFDATGNQKAMQRGPDFMAHGGRYILVGLFNGDLSFHDPSLHAKEASLLFSRNATAEDFRYVMKVLKDGLFPTEGYITHRLPFSTLANDFEALHRPETGVIKAVVSF